MHSTQRAEDDLESPAPDEPSPEEVEATLATILQSQPFRTSRQCQNLLAYIVKHSLHGDDASLRERILGIEVFGRSPDYDTSEDPVVRMRAADVRKRLAQFYQASEHGVPVVQITLKPGSYRATFHSDHEIKPSQSSAESDIQSTAVPVRRLPATDVIDLTEPGGSTFAVVPKFHLKTILLSLSLALLFGVVGWKAWTVSTVTAQQRFWAPIIRPNQPVLIYVGSNAAYRFTPEYMKRYKKEHDIKQNGPEFFIDLPKGGTIQADDLVAVKDSFVGVADLVAAVQTISLMRNWNKPFLFRSASDISIGDIRNVPCVLIGGFNNPWVLETTNDLPYSFRDGLKIENRNDPAHSWFVTPEERSSTTKDFALISRLQHSTLGGPMLTIGGIGSFGTQAAAEFVANPDKLNDLLTSAPSGWENKNMQAVLRISVVGYAPVAVDVVATSYW